MVSDVLVSGRAVILTLDPVVEHGEEGIRVSYRAPSGASPVRDVPGNGGGRAEQRTGDERDAGHDGADGGFGRDQLGPGDGPDLRGGG